MRMRHRHLPLTALRTFESAGRLLSFSKAAEELLVTQAAVSRQIRDLETHFGLPLFERHHRRVILTEAGARLLPRITQGLDVLSDAVHEVSVAQARTSIKVTSEPGFAACWLVHRLDDFRQHHPHIDVEIISEHRMFEFRSSGIDLSIRFTRTEPLWPRVEAQHLARCLATPIVSPSLYAEMPLQNPQDLMHSTLLFEDGHEFWSLWMQNAGVSFELKRGPQFNDQALVIAAAMRSHGVALGDILLIGDEPKTGRLIAPFEVSVDLGNYWLVAPSFTRLSSAGRAFAAWMKSLLPPTLRA